VTADDGENNIPPKIDFTRDIRPILSNNCFHCHGPDGEARQADLRLDRKQDAFTDRGGYRIIVPGKPEKSELYRRMSSGDADVRMPPATEKQQPTKADIALVRRWIDQGAPWEGHWAYQPPQRPPIPNVKNAEWMRNPIDAFILARLEREGLSPSPEARNTTLLRRVTLDLTGLPPTIAEMDAFLNDESPHAYERAVERLLASPAYGERMAWNWLDAARYADTNGYQGDPERTMWPWRDWLVNALNANKPFDEFTIEMLAGDLLPKPGTEQLMATGFNRNHMHNGEGGRIPEETRVENVMDRVETTSTVWLGLTMTCARCHDHKYDPITQQEYYRLYAFFNRLSSNGGGRSGQLPPVVEYLSPEDKTRRAELNRRVKNAAEKVAEVENKLFPQSEETSTETGTKANQADLPKAIRKALSRSPAGRDDKTLDRLIKHFEKSPPKYADRLKQLKDARAKRQRFNRQLPRVMIMDDKRDRKTFVLRKGTYNKPTGEPLQAGVPAVLPPLPKDAPPNRLTLARWLVSPKHPLTARVTVNRYWQLFFGTGLVKTSEDFGIQGEKPSHPRLLDWLATEFVHSGWDVKHIHRLIVTSATYRQSSSFKARRSNPAGSRATPPTVMQTIDPANRLLSRFPRYRRPSWMLRDQALAVSGLLVPELGGEPVKPYQPEGVWAEATFGKKRYRRDNGKKLYRRSLYIFWRRIVGPTLFFDTSARQTCVVKPTRTNSPLHALTTLNDTTYVEAARVFAQRVMQAKQSPQERIAFAFRLATARHPEPQERDILLKRLRLLKRQYRTNPAQAEQLLQVGEFPRDESLNTADHAAYTALCSLLLNLDEVLSKE